MKPVFKRISSPLSASESRSTESRTENRVGSDEDEESSEDSIGLYHGDDQPPHTLHRKMSMSDANSLIGGASVHREPNFTFPKVSIDKAHKIFSFQLPFGGGISFPRRVRIPFISPPNSPELDEELRLKLERNESISTIEELKIFAHFKGVDNSRLRAFKRAITPSITQDFMKMAGKRPDYETIYDELEGDLVILGGYRGSILRDCNTKKRVWIPIKAGLNLRKIDLYIGPTEQDEKDQESKIKPDGMLTHVGPVDISKKLIKKLAANPKLTVHEFGYDWRLSGSYNSDKLAQMLQKIKDKTGKPAYVIAHSMGGLIAHHVMNQNPELVRGLVYVGVPSECPNVLGPIRFGDDVLFSNKILTAEVNFMMRSSFLFLPLSGELFVNKKTLEKKNLDYFDVNNWINYNLSPLVGLNRYQFEQDLKDGKIKSLDLYEKHGGTVNTYNNMDDPVITENLTNFRTSYLDSVTYLERTLKETKKFLEELEFDPTKSYPPSTMIYGNTIPSLRGSLINDDDDIKLGNWFDFFYGPGDGVVNQHWIMPEKRGFPVVAKFASTMGHVLLMTDHDAVGKLLRSILNAENGILRRASTL